MAQNSSRTAARNLYKQMIWVGRDYPAGLDKLRPGAKRAFFATKDETDPEKIDQAFRRGEYILQELEALVKLHKYRTLRKQYNPDREDEMVASEFEKFKEKAEAPLPSGF
ncbi:LYR motifcontaining protein 5, putative [Acanthamoeba castellanii str. Neff]|uniref:LYR motifcontaining protein 5, putative n=1 Tax=Acanthamoeba castellanii (strain ATCC 30010 / Neff) TaxID=1257118 RepID=L8GPG3_ACACF|nr:LYR motifcontaining protein 5, putative [Acanthamoeba castellanii str. Neff]ELR14016.1 LYR motifcontaining protein 5, putative [Acanthamoeba castellanii str. Neff]